MKTDDKLIAEFMGFNKNVFEPEFYVLPSPYNNNGPFCSCEFLRFVNSWDWLMPVVEKIENELSKNGAYKVDGCRFWNEQFNGEISTDIKVAYAAVIEFIKWFNNVPPDKKQ